MPSPRTCVEPLAALISRSLSSSFSANRCELRLPCGASRFLRGGHRNSDIVRVDRQLEREVEGLPPRRIGTHTGVDVTAVAAPEPFAHTRVLGSPLVDQLRGGVIVELADSELVGRSEIGRTAPPTLAR